MRDIEKLHRRYGPILRIAPDEVTFSEPETWTDIFQIRPDPQQFLEDSIWWKRQPGQPDSLLSAINPESHARIRKLLTRALVVQLESSIKLTSLLLEPY